MASARPPAWLVVATAGMAAVLLGLAVAETSLKAGHYLIDQGEYLSLVGLAFILVAGIYLHWRDRLTASWPLILPWLLYPIITQGDQIIDHLSITWMRVIVHVLLALIFAMPVAVIVLGARLLLLPAGRPRKAPAWTRLVPGLAALAAGRGREGSALLAAALFVAEIWLAHQYLGALMILTLIGMTLAALAVAGAPPAERTARAGAIGRGLALAGLVAGVAVSGGLYLGFKNRPGAYQGSPSYYMDPARPDAGFDFARVAVPAGGATLPDAPWDVRDVLSGYARLLEQVLAGYYILDRNYNYHFHNELFLRETPLLPEYRRAGLAAIAEAARLRADVDARAAAVRGALPDGHPLSALLDDIRAYVAFTFERAATLERMTAGFEQTKAGLQHATHVYEGEGKYLGVQLARLLDKHGAVLFDPVQAPVTGDFVTRSRAVHDRYADRVVGF
ncbi:MAG: hypothetical protein AB1635_10605 [Acidobacteriota bacterium]